MENVTVIAATCGVFDILTPAHLYFLRKCKVYADILHVYLNDDESVKRLKGSTRPINRLENRMQMISELRCVDKVFSFPEDNPSCIIQTLKPQIWIKAGYQMEQMPEAKVVQSYGGIVVILDTIPGESTTSLIERMRQCDAL